MLLQCAIRLIARMFFDAKYLDHLSCWYIVQGMLSKLLLYNIGVPWPQHPTCNVTYPENIHFELDSLRIFLQPGSLFLAHAPITIGKNAYIARNVGILTVFHRFDNLALMTEPKPITIGDNCWIGMNSVIMPGVTLGDRTVVGAGSIVTHSFPEGNQVIAGNPARFIKVI